ncbi:MAG: hypothetical protein H5U22_06535 [Rhizobium sp.]|nr:hypothetical protein [Rhizobium sp.]
MIYTIKAIPTLYNHVQFRSRLEARWAAFFDLAGIEWDYEPFDLDGWAPDFLLTGLDILVEVKPFDFGRALSADALDGLTKVAPHARSHSVLLLGSSPWTDNSIGISLERCALVSVANSSTLWRQAGNAVQWLPPTDTYSDQINRIFHRNAA